MLPSHTSELRENPAGRSCVAAAAESAVARAGGGVTDMVYIRFRYGSPVRSRLELSCTGPRFKAATPAGLSGLIFAADRGSPIRRPRRCLLHKRHGERQQALRRRPKDAGADNRYVLQP